MPNEKKPVIRFDLDGQDLYSVQLDDDFYDTSRFNSDETLSYQAYMEKRHRLDGRYDLPEIYRLVEDFVYGRPEMAIKSDYTRHDKSREVMREVRKSIRGYSDLDLDDFRNEVVSAIEDVGPASLVDIEKFRDDLEVKTYNSTFIEVE